MDSEFSPLFDSLNFLAPFFLLLNEAGKDRPKDMEACPYTCGGQYHNAESVGRIFLLH
jgi:hypothetical protein